MSANSVKKKVVVGMSGGVDSSVAAAILIEQRWNVTGVMLRLWSDDNSTIGNRCCTPDSVDQAKGVARQLGIPFYVIDAQTEFRRDVVDYFIQSYRSGETPNPCVVCNKMIRWGYLLHKAELMGAEFFATGHYARIKKDGDHVYLQKAVDTKKDQSYVLARLNQRELSKTYFPLGNWNKQETRKKAVELGLLIANRPESQDLCFIGSGNYREFLIKYSPGTSQPGDILDTNGNKIGTHKGLAFYTIGQRKGIGIAGKEPFFVVSKDISRNCLIVSEMDLLGVRKFKIQDTNWIIDNEKSEFEAQVMTRYRSRLFQAKIMFQRTSKTAEVQTLEPIRDLAPGQLAVIYQGDLVVGSGFISTFKE